MVIMIVTAVNMSTYIVLAASLDHSRGSKYIFQSNPQDQCCENPESQGIKSNLPKITWFKSGRIHGFLL